MTKVYNATEATYSLSPETLENKTMSHPPLPPNAEWFFNYVNQTVRLTNDSKWATISDFEKLPRELKIIAAVARCAWLDEAREKRFYEKHEPFDKKRNIIEISEEQWQGFYEMDCESHAEAWRIWGEQR